MINFLGYKKQCIFLTLFLVSAGVFGYFKNGFLTGIDFSGGTEFRIRFDNNVDIASLRKIFINSNFENVSLQSLASGREFLLKISDQNPNLENKISAVLSKECSEKYEFISVEHVGPEAGQEVTNNTIISILLMLIALLLYIALRHRYDYSVGAIAALVHDILVLMSFYLFFKIKFSLNILMGILLVLGYSINDTIVIWSRIKANARLLRGKANNEEIVNISINQTLIRTLLTSFTTFIATFALYWFGGSILEDFSISMLIGIVCGTYSSIFIAAPVMLAFGSKEL